MSTFNFKQVAQNTSSLSPIMAGREKLSTEDILDKVLTVVEFGFAPKMDQDNNVIINPETDVPEEYGVLVFSEMPGYYYSVGTIFTNICKAWAAGFDTTENASKALAESGGVKVRFVPGKTKNGNNLTKVLILD